MPDAKTEAAYLTEYRKLLDSLVAKSKDGLHALCIDPYRLPDCGPSEFIHIRDALKEFEKTRVQGRNDDERRTALVRCALDRSLSIERALTRREIREKSLSDVDPMCWHVGVDPVDQEVLEDLVAHLRAREWRPFEIRVVDLDPSGRALVVSCELFAEVSVSRRPALIAHLARRFSETAWVTRQERNWSYSLAVRRAAQAGVVVCSAV